MMSGKNCDLCFLDCRTLHRGAPSEFYDRLLILNFDVIFEQSLMEDVQKNSIKSKKTFPELLIKKSFNFDFKTIFGYFLIEIHCNFTLDCPLKLQFPFSKIHKQIRWSFSFHFNFLIYIFFHQFAERVASN